jgi:hypothetical protein
MTKTRAIKVDGDCLNCPLNTKCENVLDLGIIPVDIPESCPLPAWPSVTKEAVDNEYCRIILGGHGNFSEFLKSLGLEIVEEKP